MPLKHVALVAIGTAALLLVPVMGNWPWTSSDFFIAGTLIFVTGLLVTLVLQKGGKYRIIAAVGILFLFVWLWAELAVGVFTNWRN